MSNYDQTATRLLAIMVYMEGGMDVSGQIATNMKIQMHTSWEGDIMNADQLKGKWMQFKGELKEKYGKFTDDDLKQIEGNYEKFVGKAQERYGDKKDALMKWAEEWHEKPAPKAVGKSQ